uniref:Sphingomyelin phosphodiesterase C-terminal domain-containing protein n=1 Tax=Oncorhynchus tshawytscha TaxID=74940 RepID=A0A8C8JB17_ONCTS
KHHNKIIQSPLPRFIHVLLCSPLRVSQPQTLVFLETSCVTLPAHPVSFQHMKQVAPQPEFMIWTRDSHPHVPSGELSTDVVIQVISNMTQTIREFLLDMPVYPALRNHDNWPQVRCDSKWSVVISHVPVGYLPYARNTKAVRELYSERLVKIIRNYREIISGHFYGHTHRDSIMFLQDQQGGPVSSLFVTPAVTPIKKAEEPYSNNRDYGLLDIWQYYLNLIEANQEKRSDWKLEYLGQSETFQKYFCHFMVSYDVCDGACKLTQVFAVQPLDYTSYIIHIEKGH